MTNDDWKFLKVGQKLIYLGNYPNAMYWYAANDRVEVAVVEFDGYDGELGIQIKSVGLSIARYDWVETMYFTPLIPKESTYEVI